MNLSKPKIRLARPGALKRFARNESGSITVEAVMNLPLLFLVMFSSYVFFDSYRKSASNLKAAYAIADVLSRETRVVNDAYINTMYDLQQIMVNDESEKKLRVSLIVWDENEQRHYVRWSADRGFGTKWTDSNIAAIKERLPPMPDQDTVILVETSNQFAPPFNIGWGDEIKLENFVFTRPRITNEIPGDFGGDGDSGLDVVHSDE